MGTIDRVSKVIVKDWNQTRFLKQLVRLEYARLEYGVIYEVLCQYPASALVESDAAEMWVASPEVLSWGIWQIIVGSNGIIQWDMIVTRFLGNSFGVLVPP